MAQDPPPKMPPLKLPPSGSPRNFELPSFDAGQADESQADAAAEAEGDGKSENSRGAASFALLETPPTSGGFKDSFEEELLQSSSDFASMRFTRESTLLTDAESYAQSIREEAELYALLLRNETERLRSEAAEAQRDALQELETAEERVSNMLQDAQQQVDLQREQAEKEGYQKGYAEGGKKAL